jgi:PilZ domain-containing protein
MQNARKLEPSNPEAAHRPKPVRSSDRMDEIISDISGDRRNRRRYDIDLHVQYKVFRHYQVAQSGTGKTINLSGGGIAFEIDEVLMPGAAIELAIAWPVLLNKTCPLKLVVTGKVVRSDAMLTAVRMERYEFRTQGVRTLQAMAAGSPF